MLRWIEVAAALRSPGMSILGWHSMEAAELCNRCAFALPDRESAQAVELARRAVELETEDGDGHPTVVLALGTALVRDGQLAEGLEILTDMWQDDRQTWPTWLLMQVAGVLSLGLVEAERGEECDRVLREIAPLADAVEQGRREAATPGFAAVRIAGGRRAYQQGDAERAVEVLRRAVTLAELHPRTMVLVTGLVYLAEAELATGGRGAARDALTRARELRDDEGIGGYALRRLEQAEARMGRGSARAAVRSGAMVEELTDRELSILRTHAGGRDPARDRGRALLVGQHGQGLQQEPLPQAGRGFSSGRRLGRPPARADLNAAPRSPSGRP